MLIQLQSGFLNDDADASMNAIVIIIMMMIINMKVLMMEKIVKTPMQKIKTIIMITLKIKINIYLSHDFDML
jgi:hypothetical protein